MTNLKLLEKQLVELLKIQNPNHHVDYGCDVPFDSFVEIDIKTPNTFLQIDNLDSLIENTGFSLIKFIMNHHSSINIQSFNCCYAIKLSNNCSTYSFFLKTYGEVNIELGDDCTCIFKGKHTIKRSKNCIIENALKRS